MFVVRYVYRDLGAVAVRRPELFALAPRVIFYDAVRGVQYILGGTVVLLQLDHLAVFELVLKAEDILYIRASELVYTLIVVADYAEVFMLGGEQADQPVLRVVGILILVDQYVFEPILVVVEYVLVLLKKFHRLADQIVEVERVVLHKLALIQLVYPRYF